MSSRSYKFPQNGKSLLAILMLLVSFLILSGSFLVMRGTIVIQERHEISNKLCPEDPSCTDKLQELFMEDLNFMSTLIDEASITHISDDESDEFTFSVEYPRWFTSLPKPQQDRIARAYTSSIATAWNES